MRLATVILNYQTPALVAACLSSLCSEIDAARDRVIVVDNGSGDGSYEHLVQLIRERGWDGWATVIGSPVNGGFAAGNNRVLATVRADTYLLLNSDTVVRRGAVAELLGVMQQRPDVGVVGPRLEWPDGGPQLSCFRFPSALGDFLAAAATGPLNRLLHSYSVRLPLSDAPMEPQWISFAAALLRREVVERVGLLDEGYFMYFEDVDYCRRTLQAGWQVVYWPAAHVVHLHAGRQTRAGRSTSRWPRYYYASRARYFAKFHGRVGLWIANALWSAGRTVSRARQWAGDTAPHLRNIGGGEIWTNWKDPMQPWMMADARRSEGRR